MTNNLTPEKIEALIAKIEHTFSMAGYEQRLREKLPNMPMEEIAHLREDAEKGEKTYNNTLNKVTRALLNIILITLLGFIASWFDLIAPAIISTIILTLVLIMFLLMFFAFFVQHSLKKAVVIKKVLNKTMNKKEN